MKKMNLMKVYSITIKQLGETFDALDINNDGSLALDELSLYLKGANLSKSQ
jgi:Ca2+-binding EF-hand superfamily protein